MKYMNIIKLLTVLLCIGMLFVACDNAETESSEEVTTEATESTPAEIESESGAEESATETEAPTEALTKEELLESVEAKFENFFENLADESGELTTAERIEGKIIDQTQGLIIVKQSDINVKNVVTETYKVYNLKTGEVVLTLTDDYFNGEYDDFDFDTDDFRVFANSVLVDNGDGTFSPESKSEKTYRESYMEVAILKNNQVDIICVAHATVTPIDDATRAANPEGCVYTVETKYSYYDVFGTLITESAKALNISYLTNSSPETATLLFGYDIAYFDLESGRFITKEGIIEENAVSFYRYENDRYSYYSPTTGMGGQYSTIFMDIVEKSSGKVIRYHFDQAYQSYRLFFLHNGDVVIEYKSVVDEDDPYDYYSLEGDTFYYYAIKTVILNAENGNEIVIENPAFYIQSMQTGEEFSESQNIAAYNGLKITANTRNVALIQKITDGVLSDKNDVVVLDNDLSVLYTFERVVDQQTFDTATLGYTTLKNGDKLLGIGGERAIVAADGKVRAYLTSEMAIVGDYIADGTKLYDYDLNLVCNYGEKDYFAVELFGECVFFAEKDQRIMSFTVVDGNIVLEDLFEDKVRFVAGNDDFAIIYNAETGKYVLYNESMTAILVSSGYISVTPIEDGAYFAITAQAGGEDTCYVLK